MYIIIRSKVSKIEYLIFFNLATNTTVNAKINDIKSKKTTITSLLLLLLMLKLMRLKAKYLVLLN